MCVQWNSTAQRYRDDILQSHMLQQNNALPHKARVTLNFVTQSNIYELPWPSKSPDLNPIEHLWDEFDRRVCQRQSSPQSLDQFSQALQHEWQRIPQVRIQNLIRFMPRRCRTVLAAHGGHNRYWHYRHRKFIQCIVYYCYCLVFCITFVCES